MHVREEVIVWKSTAFNHANVPFAKNLSRLPDCDAWLSLTRHLRNMIQKISWLDGSQNATVYEWNVVTSQQQ